MMENSQAYWREVDELAGSVRGRLMDRGRGSAARANAQEAAARGSTWGRRTGGRLQGWTTKLGVALHPSLAPKGQAVTVGPELWTAVGQALDAAAPALARAYDEHLATLAMETFFRWPVATGFSASSLVLAYSLSGDGLTFTGTFASLAWYTPYIRYAKPKSPPAPPGGATRRDKDRALALAAGLPAPRQLHPRARGSGNPWASYVPGRQWATVKAIAESADQYLGEAVRRG